MVSAGAIKDADSLRAWLEGRPREEVLVVLSRNALRVAHPFWGWIGNDNSLPASELALSRSLLVSLIAGVSARADLLDAARDATHGAALSRSNEVAVKAQLADVERAIGHASSVCYGVFNMHPLLGFFSRYDPVTLAAVRADCLVVEARSEIYHLPLWNEERSQDDQCSTVLRNWRVRGGGWVFWADWYEGYLTGKPLDLDLLEKVALIPSAEWDKGDDHVNGMIADIYDERESPTTEIDRPPLNLALIARQASVLRDYIVGELERARGRNSDSDADLPRLELLKELLQEALAAVDGILEHLASSSDDQSTALVVVEQKLPVIVDAAERLATEAKAPRVSEPMLAIAATMKVLTEAGMDPKDAARLASGDVLGPRLIAWFRSWLPKRK